MYKVIKPIFDIHNPEIKANVGEYVVIEDEARLKKAVEAGLVKETEEESKDFITFVKEIEKKTERKTASKK